MSTVEELLREGEKLHLQGNLNAARVFYDSALLIDPDHPIALQNLSGILFASGQNAAALSVSTRALAAAPGNMYALANHAASLIHLNRFREAIPELEHVLSQIPNTPGIWHNYSLALYQEGRIPEAISAIEKTLELQGENIPGLWLSDYGIFSLASSDLQLGLARYEARWNMITKSHIWKLPIKEWQGENILSKRILVHHEQGFGDGIMLCRFVHNLMSKGAIVTVAAPSELIRLFGCNFPCPIIDWKSTINPREFDFHSPMLSVLRWLNINKEQISPLPYIGVEGKWKQDLPCGFRIGICWESGDHSPNPVMKARRRVIPLELFFPLAEILNVRLVSLQKGNSQKDIINSGAESFIFDPMGRVEDFYDTAQIINELDLVVTVDSAVAHLAGAMGKRVLMLGPYTRCWRWWSSPLGIPWYSNFEIVPQSIPGEWKSEMDFIPVRVREIMND